MNGDGGSVFVKAAIEFVTFVTVLVEALTRDTVLEGGFESRQDSTEVGERLGKAELARFPAQFRANVCGEIGDKEGFSRAAVTFDRKEAELAWLSNVQELLKEIDNLLTVSETIERVMIDLLHKHLAHFW